MCSRGSVIPLWIDQIRNGNPITFTNYRVEEIKDLKKRFTRDDYVYRLLHSDEEFDWKLTEDEKKLFKSAIEDYARDFCENATLDEFITDYELAMLDDNE